MRLMPATRSAALLVAVGMRRVALAGAAERIAAQRHDMADAGLRHRRAITASISARVGGDAGQMRGRRQRGLGEDAFDGRVGALARRAAGAIGHRDEGRPQRRQPRDRLPQRLFHLRGFRREESKETRILRGMPADEAAWAGCVHHATSRVVARQA